jgi:COP9 signalosome complex subunit 7
MMKLRHLSIISMASKCRTVSYKTLCQQLGIDNIRELEDLIIEAFYADVIKGKLDQLNNHLEIDFAIGRDVTDHQVDEILNVLDNWYLVLNIYLIYKNFESVNVPKSNQNG